MLNGLRRIWCGNPAPLLALLPSYKLTKLSATPVSTLEQARKIATGAGLHYVTSQCAGPSVQLHVLSQVRCTAHPPHALSGHQESYRQWQMSGCKQKYGHLDHIIQCAIISEFFGGRIYEDCETRSDSKSEMDMEGAKDAWKQVLSERGRTPSHSVRVFTIEWAVTRRTTRIPSSTSTIDSGQGR